MGKGKINQLMELLKHNMQNHVALINEVTLVTLVQLKQKHPQDKEAYPKVLLSDISKEIRPIRLHSKQSLL